MANREIILQAYQADIKGRIKKGYLHPVEVRALKIFCQVFQISLAEHNQVASQCGLNPRDLMDESNQLFTDWLEKQRAPLTASGGGLAFLPPDRQVWKKRLTSPASHRENMLAVLAGGAVIVCLLIVLL